MLPLLLRITQLRLSSIVVENAIQILIFASGLSLWLDEDHDIVQVVILVDHMLFEENGSSTSILAFELC
jgi:hypothetical protein